MLTATTVKAGIDELTERGMFPTIKTSSDVIPALPYRTYLIDASGGLRTVTLPLVSAGDESWYRVMMDKDSNHIRIIGSGGQLIDGLTQAGVRGTKQALILKANGY